MGKVQVDRVFHSGFCFQLSTFRFAAELYRVPSKSPKRAEDHIAAEPSRISPHRHATRTHNNARDPPKP
jgi:hypothetical protein